MYHLLHDQDWLYNLAILQILQSLGEVLKLIESDQLIEREQA